MKRNSLIKPNNTIYLVDLKFTGNGKIKMSYFIDIMTNLGKLLLRFLAVDVVIFILVQQTFYSRYQNLI